MPSSCVGLEMRIPWVASGALNCDEIVTQFGYSTRSDNGRNCHESTQWSRFTGSIRENDEKYF